MVESLAYNLSTFWTLWLTFLLQNLTLNLKFKSGRVFLPDLLIDWQKRCKFKAFLRMFFESPDSAFCFPSRAKKSLPRQGILLEAYTVHFCQWFYETCGIFGRFWIHSVNFTQNIPHFIVLWVDMSTETFFSWNNKKFTWLLCHFLL